MSLRPPIAADFDQPFDGARYTPISQSKLQTYRGAWNFYSQVQQLQLSIRSRLLAGESISYYRFRNYQEKEMYMLGMRLYNEAFPGTVDWCDPITDDILSL
jgi:hypothetical protein